MSSQQKVNLTEREKREYGEKLGQLLAELEEAEKQKASIASSYGVTIKSLKVRIHDLGEALRHGYEWRDAETLPFEKKDALA